MTGEQGICSMAVQPNRDSVLNWRKSSASGESGQCIEVAKSGSSVLVRDSHNPSGAVLVFTRAQWLGLLRHIRNPEGAHL
jgi:hypothetical protein